MKSWRRFFFVLGYHDRAIKHCHKVFLSAPQNENVLYLVGLAHYELRQFREAKYYFGQLRIVSLSKGRAATELLRCGERLREVEGRVNILKLFRACQTDTTTPIDHGTFSKNIPFREGLNYERSVFATQDVGPGTLILAEKPIVVTFEQPHFPSETGRVHFMRTALWAVMKNPKSVGRKLYGLPGGGAPTEEEKKIFCDEVNELEPILHVQRLNRLINRNILKTKNAMVQDGPYSYQVLELASRFRHSCLSNCTVIAYKDVITVRTCTPVSKGEEFIVSFYGNRLSFPEKRTIFERIGYACSCDLCDFDKMETTEVHKSREALKAKFYTQLSLYGSVPDAAELNLVPIVQELELTYGGRHSLRSLLFLVYCDLTKVLDRSSEEWKWKVTNYVTRGLGSVGLSIDVLLSLPDQVNSKILKWVLIPEVVFEYAAIMADLEYRNGHLNHVQKWLNVLFFLESIYTGGGVEMLMHRLRDFSLVKSLLSAHGKNPAQRSPTGSHLG